MSLLGEIQAALPGSSSRTESLPNPAPAYHRLESDLFRLSPTYNFSLFTPSES